MPSDHPMCGPVFPVMGPYYTAPDYVRLDLSPGSALLAGWVAGEMPDLDRRIRGAVAHQGGRLGWGGYLEERRLYQVSAYFGTGAAMRSLHLGLDIWAEAGTRLFAPYDAVVHSLAFNGNHLDYGATIILSHESVGTKEYLLFGHLALRDLERWAPGARIEAGECFAHIGMAEENGGWVPHLHLQRIREIGDWKGDFPGVARTLEREAWEERCPNPFSLVFPDTIS
jgi:peptidoglycan LD-endopeptidase LytH